MIPRHVQITLLLLLAAIFLSGLYILLLRRGTEENLRRAADQTPVSSDASGTRSTVKLTVAYDDEGVFRLREVQTALPAEPSARAKAVLQALVNEYVQRPSPHSLAPGSAIDAVFLVNGKLAVVDLNLGLAEGHRSGIMVEDLTVISLVDTLAANFPGIEQVEFLVDGKQRETLAGHTDLRSVYSTSVVHNLVTQLQ